MIEYFWKRHIELADAGFISRKTCPKGHSGSVNKHLSMETEGINLSFYEKHKALLR